MADESSSPPPEWNILDDRLLTPCRVWDLRARHYRHPHSGREGEFYYLDSRDWAVVVARTTSGEFIFVRQFRWGADALSWEIPGGIVDAGEDPLAAGLRELQEETGYTAASGRLIGTCRPNPAILNNYCHVILAEGCRLSEAGKRWDEHEEMEVRLLAEATVMEWARTGRIGHALALNGLLYYRLHLEQEAAT